MCGSNCCRPISPVHRSDPPPSRNWPKPAPGRTGWGGGGFGTVPEARLPLISSSFFRPSATRYRCRCAHLPYWKASPVRLRWGFRSFRFLPGLAVPVQERPRHLPPNRRWLIRMKGRYTGARRALVLFQRLPSQCRKSPRFPAAHRVLVEKSGCLQIVAARIQRTHVPACQPGCGTGVAVAGVLRSAGGWGKAGGESRVGSTRGWGHQRGLFRQAVSTRALPHRQISFSTAAGVFKKGMGGRRGGFHG